MIPDLHWNIIQIGPLPIQVWGLFVATGIAVGLYVAKRYAESRNLDGKLLIDASFWIILGGLIGTRLFFVLTEWHIYINDLAGVFKIWEGGMSINGAFLGGAFAGYLFFKKRKVSVWMYLDTIMYALPLGLAIGRLGCFFIFDHPGSITGFALGEQYYYDGEVHHNHGLYLSINAMIMFIVFTVAKLKYKPRPPFFIIGFFVWYGIYRIVADFDRILDNTFAGLTAAQWTGMGMIVLGLVIFGQRQNIRKSLKKP